MPHRRKLNLLKKVIIALTLLVVIVFLVIFIIVNTNKLEFSASYYYVYYSMQDEAINASTLSETIKNYGGAGYIIKHKNKFYITISCYYSYENAEEVCQNLSKMNFNCDILTVNVSNFTLPSGTKSNDKETYLGNLNTLHSLSTICYQTANKLDMGEYNQSDVKGVISDVKGCISQLLHSNEDNVFTQNLTYLLTLCNDFDNDYILSRQIRQLQIAITDCVINTL